MGFMFKNNSSFSQDIRVWPVATGTNMTNMFNGTNAMTAIYGPSGTNPDSDYNGGNPNIGFFNYVPPQFADKNALQIAVNLWISNKASALTTYGEINTWDVSNITEINRLFQNKGTFDDDISNWNISNVTNMEMMFHGAGNFNQDISDWDVSNVTNMNALLSNAINFNHDIRVWSVANNTNLNWMFYNTPAMAAIYGPSGTNPDSDYNGGNPNIGFFNYVSGSITITPDQILFYNASNYKGTMNISLNIPAPTRAYVNTLSILPALPNGLIFNADGSITGKPTAISSNVYTVTAFTSTSSITREFSITIEEVVIRSMSHTNRPIRIKFKN